MLAKVAPRLRATATPLPPPTRVRIMTLILSIMMVSNVWAEPLRAETSTMKLRVEWGGGVETTWQGSIHVPGGRIVNKNALGIEADEPGSMWIEDGRLMIQQKGQRRYDGVDLEFVAPLDGKLVVALSSGVQPADVKPIEIKLNNLLNDQHSEELQLAGKQNRLLVRRAPGDRLRVQVLNQSLVLSPQDTLRLKLQPHLLGIAAGTEIQIQSRIVRARSNAEIATQKMTVTIPAESEFLEPRSLDFPAPDDEGVY
ncbi:MAG: hypothetical protein N2C12_08460, partial [Planctomycetales bacterium]